MREPIAVLLVAASFTVAGCDETPASTGGAETAETAETADGFGPIAQTWVDERVAEAEARLTASPAGTLVWRAIGAHGGLARWLEKGTIEFEFDYQPVDQPERRMHTFSRVDLWRSRAHQEELGEGADATLAFDGERAWISPGPEAFPTPPRFWATTPYYFVGVPFVMGDPGARFEQLEDAALDGVPHHVVRVTYESGTGDSPEDYYVLYIHPETGRVGALRYVVAYPGFFPEGGHSPEKIMVMTEPYEVDGLTFAGRLDTYRWNAETGERGDLATEIRVSRTRLGQRYDEDLLAPPSTATVRTEIVGRE